MRGTFFSAGILSLLFASGALARGQQLYSPHTPPQVPAQHIWLEQPPRAVNGWNEREFFVTGATDGQPNNNYYDIFHPDEIARLLRAQGYYYCEHRHDKRHRTGGRFDFGNGPSGPFFTVERTIQARKDAPRTIKALGQAGRIAAYIGGIWFGNPEAFAMGGEAWDFVLTQTPEFRGFKNNNHPSTAGEWFAARDFHMSAEKYWNCQGVVRFQLN